MVGPPLTKRTIDGNNTWLIPCMLVFVKITNLDEFGIIDEVSMNVEPSS